MTKKSSITRLNLERWQVCIIIQGCTYEECEKCLLKVLDKLYNYDMHLNINKHKFLKNNVECGHVTST